MDMKIICHTTVKDIGTIGQMKEKLLMACFVLCNAPPAVHDNATCSLKNYTRCLVSWVDFWVLAVVPKLLDLNGEINNQLWWIWTDCMANAMTLDMLEKCVEWTTVEVVGKPAWMAESRIPEGVVKVLMVPEHIMLGIRPEEVLNSNVFTSFVDEKHTHSNTFSSTGSPSLSMLSTIYYNDPTAALHIGRCFNKSNALHQTTIQGNQTMYGRGITRGFEECPVL